MAFFHQKGGGADKVDNFFCKNYPFYMGVFGHFYTNIIVFTLHIYQYNKKNKN